MFNGFTQETSDFLFNISFNNERPWFLAHKSEYEQFVKAPLDALAADVLDIMRKRFPDDDLTLHVARIYRDARRLFGRGPYKDHLWFTIQHGKFGAFEPVYWFEVSADTYAYGVGAWDATPRHMEIYRRRIDADPVGFERMVTPLTKADGFRLWGDEYKRPKGDKGETLNRWYNRKTLSAGYEFDFGGDALSPNLPQIVVDAFVKLTPLQRFLKACCKIE